MAETKLTVASLSAEQTAKMGSPRIYAIIVTDTDLNKVDEYDFAEIGDPTSTAPRITSPSGIGDFKQKVTVQSGDVTDYVIRQAFERVPMSMGVNFIGPDSMQRTLAFKAWISQYINAEAYRITFRFKVSGTSYHIDVTPTEFKIGETKGGVTTSALTLLPITLPYTTASQTVVIATATVSKQYPYVYPYSYGGGTYQNTGKIQNDFIKDIPLIVIFHGHISSPEASLEQDGTTYATIKFTGLDLKAGCTLKVDALNSKIIYTDASGNETNYWNEIDKTESTFLKAKPGTSYLTPNLDQTDASKPYVEIGIRGFNI